MEEFTIGCMCKRLFDAHYSRDFVLKNIYGSDFIPCEIRMPIIEFKKVMNEFVEDGEIKEPKIK